MPVVVSRYDDRLAQVVELVDCDVDANVSVLRPEHDHTFPGHDSPRICERSGQRDALLLEAPVIDPLRVAQAVVDLALAWL